MHLRLRYKQLGGHVHVRVFMGRDSDHLAKCGDLAFREDERDKEFTAFRSKLTDGPEIVQVDVLEDDIYVT